jgi:hypothetical protein
MRAKVHGYDDEEEFTYELLFTKFRDLVKELRNFPQK